MQANDITQNLQLLTFHLGDEVFGVDIGQVREVLEFTPMTRIPGMPPAMCGAINLRGRVVPVVDMRMKFGMAPSQRTVNTCIIILEVANADQRLVVGALADSVREVITLEADDVEPPPTMGTGLDTTFIRAMGKRDDTFVIVLDVDRLFHDNELGLMTTPAIPEEARELPEREAVASV